MGRQKSIGHDGAWAAAVDGASFPSWNDQFAPVYTRAQNADGSWTPPGDERIQGKVYGTTLAALTLQVYYRLLPTYRDDLPAPEEPGVEDPAEEDLFEVI